MFCGIYKITNLINQKIYVGQSVDIKKRYRDHIFASQHPESKDAKMPIHLAMAKYGVENFSLEILEECSKEELNDKEIFWIKQLNSYHNGYNANTGGGNFEHLGKQVDCYDFNGNYIASYNSVTEMAEQLGASRTQAYQVLQGKRKSFQGMQIKYHEDIKTITPYKNKQGGKIAVYQINKQTNEIINTFESAAEAGRITGADPSTIIKVCKGKLKSTKGFKWRYIT